MIFRFFIIIHIFFCFFLASCTPMNVITSTTSAGAVVAEGDRTIGESVDDAGIKIKISEKFIKSSTGIFLDIDVTVRTGIVVLTGIVETQDIRMEAVKLVWEVKGVKEVRNEIEVGNKQELKDYAKDLWISTQIKTKTINELGLDAITYNFETINGRVHVIGITKNLEESEKVIKVIRTVKGVKEIINHIILRE